MEFLKNKTVIVTGGSSGIGFELSKQLIQNYGCCVLGIARNAEKLEKAQKVLGEKFIPISCDVSAESEWIRLKDYVTECNLKPNIIINNAGIMLPFVKAKDYAETDFTKILQTNLMSVIYSTRHILPILEGEKGIVNISSSSSLCPVVGQSGYCATKSAVKSFTEVLQTEADYYVGLFMPGFCKTNIMRSIDMTAKDKKLIDKVSISADKCAKKILKAINRKKQRKVIGVDAKFMNFLYKIMPKSAGKFIAWILRKSKLKLFDGIQ